MLQSRTANDPRVSSWWKNEFNLGEISQSADILLHRFEDSDFVSIGQSPAWILKAVETLSSIRGEPRTCAYAAFSHSGTEAMYCYNEKDHTYLRNKDYPDIKAASIKYRTYLKDSRLDPESIIKKHKAGRKTTLVDYGMSGSCIASFLGILIEWADEKNLRKELLESIGVGAIFSDDIILGGVALPELGAVVPAQPIPCDKYTMRSLFGTLSQDTPDNDRIVPAYRQENWANPPKPLTQNHETVKQVEAAIAQGVQTYDTDLKARLERHRREVEAHEAAALAATEERKRTKAANRIALLKVLPTITWHTHPKSERLHSDGDETTLTQWRDSGFLNVSRSKQGKLMVSKNQIAGVIALYDELLQGDKLAPENREHVEAQRQMLGGILQVSSPPLPPR